MMTHLDVPSQDGEKWLGGVGRNISKIELIVAVMG